METSGFVAEQSGVAIHTTNQLMDDAKKDEVEDQESALLQVILRLETHFEIVEVPIIGSFVMGRPIRANSDAFGGSLADIEMSIVKMALKFVGGKGYYWIKDFELISNSYKANSEKFLELASRGYGQDIMRILENDPTLIMTQSTNRMKDTALHLAARSGHEDIVKLLVRFILEERKETLNLSQRMVPLFIRGSRRLFQQNMQGDTPLHVAVKNGHVEVASYLITKNPKAAYYYFNKRGFSPLGLAVFHGHQGIVQEVFKGLSVTEFASEMRRSALHVNGSSLVHHVLRARNITMLQLLLENIPDLIDTKDLKGRKPLSYASRKGYLEEISYLLTKFPKYANVCDEDGTFPLHNAVKRGHLKVVAELLTRCPQTIYQTNQEHQTILHIAVRYSRIQVLTYMKNESLKKQVGEIVNSRDVNGVTFKELAIRRFPNKR